MLYKIFERLFYGFTVNNNADVPPKHDVPLITWPIHYTQTNTGVQEVQGQKEWYERLQHFKSQSDAFE